VEKVIFLLIGGNASVGLTLRTETIAAVRAAGGRRIQVNVPDHALGHPFGVTPDADQPQLTAALSAWVDTAEASPISDALPEPSGDGRWFGYLVSEAEPLPNRDHPPGPDGRVPGFAQLVPLSVPDGLSWAEWRRRWQGAHTAVAVATQSTFRYVQNVVLRSLTPGAPHYAAVVEECFPIEAATDLHVFFDAVGDEAKLARHMAAMSESCDRFMDGVAPVAWTVEYVFPDSPGESEASAPA
jgi:hypothetical protein